MIPIKFTKKAVLLLSVCIVGLLLSPYYCLASSKIFLKKNRSFQAQVVKPNTQYIIRSSFDLGGSVIRVPEGCTLSFRRKGKVSNGVIVGSNTKITGDVKQIFRNTIVSGSFSCEVSYPEWFGATADGVNDDTRAIQLVLQFHNVRLQANKTYSITELKLPSMADFTITGDNSLIKCNRTSIDEVFNVIGNQDMASTDTTFCNGVFILTGVIVDANCNNYKWDSAPNPNGYNALALDNFRKVILQDCTFRNTLMCGVRTTICDTVMVKNCTFENIGSDDGPIRNYGWQWEGVSQSGMRYLNGNPNEILLRNCSLLEVSDCSFYNILNSIAGASNTRIINITNNKCDRLHSFFSEFHINDSEKESIDTIIINNNVIDREAGALISLSGKYNGKENTKVQITNNIIKRFNGDSLPKYHVARDDVMYHLLLLYCDSGKSNITLQYDNNKVYSSNQSTLDTYILLSGLRKASFTNSLFEIYGNTSGMSTIIYSPFCELNIKNCTFVCNTSYTNFCTINDHGVRITETKIENPVLNKSSIICVQNQKDAVITSIDVDRTSVNFCDRLLFLNTLPKMISVTNSIIGGDIGTTNLGNAFLSRAEKIIIKNNQAKKNGLKNIPTSTKVLSDNKFDF